MSEKVSFKANYVIFLILGIGLILSSCINPTDAQGFLDNVNAGGKVKLTSDSEGTAGNCIISVPSNKYYKIEKMEGSDPVETCFVKTNGALSKTLKDIGKVTGGVITGLENDVTYRVISAKPYTNTDSSIKYFPLQKTVGALNLANVTDGKVTIFEKEASRYFDVSDTIVPTKFYEVMKIKTSESGNGIWQEERTSAFRQLSGTVISTLPTDNTNYKPFKTALSIGIFQFRTDDLATIDNITALNLSYGMSIMELPAVDTDNDYIFVEYDKDDEDITKDFYVLTVSVKTPQDGNGTVTITPPDLPTNQTITLTYYKNGVQTSANEESITILQGEANKTITASGGTSYEWFIITNTIKTSISTTSSIDIGTITNLTTPGTYTIMVETTVGTIVYSRCFVLKK